MPTQTRNRRYRSTESKYKGRAKELYVTYDLVQQTRGGGTSVYPRVKRVYIAGNVKDWRMGDFTKRTGRPVRGVKIQYEQTRSGYRRNAFSATRGTTNYAVRPTRVQPTVQKFTQVVEVPEHARRVRFHTGQLPEKYQSALQSVR